MSDTDGADDTDGEDGYDGPAAVLVAGQTHEVTVTLRGVFEPISGHYRWYGRITGLTAQTTRTVGLRTPHGEVSAQLGDVDPWGRVRVEGSGAAPFPVLSDVPSND